MQYLWRRYKAGEKHVKQWLLQHANHDFEDADQLTGADLLSLADSIRQTALDRGKAPPGVADVIKILKSDIEGRKECAKWIAHHQPETRVRKEADLRHQHHIDILISVLRLLKAAKVQQSEAGPAEATAKGEQVGKGVGSDTLNRLALLEVHEPQAEEQAQATSSPQPTLPLHDPSKTQAPSIEDEHANERDLAIRCLFRELELIRSEIRSIWTKHTKGETKLENAYLVTTHAMALFEAAVADLVEEFPEFELFDGVAELLHLESHISKGHPDPATDFPQEQIDSPDGSLQLAWDTICIFRELFHLDSAPVVDKTAFAKVAEKLHHSGRMLFLLNADFRKMADESSRGLTTVSRDAFVESFANFTHSRGVIKTALFGLLQIHIDICIILDAIDPGHARKDLARQIALLRDPVISHEDFLQRTSDEDRTDTLMDLVNSVALACIGVPLAEIDPDRHIARTLMPVVTGMYAWELTHKIHRYNIALCDQEGLLVATAHLYQACRASGAMKEAWPEMDKLIQLQGAQFLGLSDTTSSSPSMETRAKRYGLAMGVELVQYAKVKNQKQVFQQKISLPRGPKAARKPLQLGSTIMSKLGTRDNTPHDPRSEQSKGSIIVLHQVAEEMIKQHPQLVSKAAVKKWNEERTLAPDQLLSILNKSMEVDAPNLELDYLGLYESCSKIASRLEKRPLIGSSEFQDMVNDILWSAAERERQAASSKGRATGADWLGVASRIIVACAGLSECPTSE